MDTIKLMLKAANNNSAFNLANFAEEEEEHHESKPSKKGKSIFLEDLFPLKELVNDNLSRIRSKRNVDFSSADYSLKIYCPPEVA
jgi:hypothetical protein